MFIGIDLYVLLLHLWKKEMNKIQKQKDKKSPIHDRATSVRAKVKPGNRNNSSEATDI